MPAGMHSGFKNENKVSPYREVVIITFIVVLMRYYIPWTEYNAIASRQILDDWTRRDGHLVGPEGLPWLHCSVHGFEEPFLTLLLQA